LKLFEHESKNILGTYGVPTPRGDVATTAGEAAKIAANLNPPYVVKAQVLVAGRGKAGGILFAETPLQVEEAAERLFQTPVKDIPVKKVLVEEKISVAKELYVGLTVERVERTYVVVASASGGVDIEEAAVETPQSFVKELVDPQRGFRMSDAKEIAEKLGYSDGQQFELSRILARLYRVGMDYDAELIEMNPLAETDDGSFVAVDAHLVIDDSALFRHPDFERQQYSEDRQRNPEEAEAEKAGIAYVKLNGNVGVVGNGAGLVMATLDMIQHYGGEAADFLDLGGGAPVERIAKALGIIMSDAGVKVVLVNILGGITHCDDVARAITQTKAASKVTKPFVVRLVGTNEAEGRRILEEAGIAVLDSMEDAAKRAVEIVREND
jgi:succinyl-CoA synthetase beta subunit